MGACAVSTAVLSTREPAHSKKPYSNEHMSDASGGRRISLAGNLSWAAGGAIVRLSAQLGCQMILARLLSPADYGIFGIALIVTTFAAFLSEFGGAAALVKNKSISVHDVRANFTLQIVIGLVVMFGLAFAATSIADLLHKPECAPVMRVLSINCFVNMLSVVSVRLLARQMRFREIQVINISGYLVGYVVVGIPMAYLQFGVWSLVAAWFVQTATTLVASYALIRHNLVPYLSAKHVVTQFGFGVQTFFSGILTWAIISADRIVVARFNTPGNVGLYTNGYNLASAPIWQIVSSLQQVLFSNASKDQSDLQRLQDSFRRSLIVVTTFAIPAFFTLAAASAETVFLIYGAKWAAAALVVTPLAMAMPFYAMNGVSTPVMWGTGRISLDVMTQSATFVCLVAGLFLVAHLPMAAAAWVVLGVYIARAIAAVYITSRLLGHCVNLRQWVGRWIAVGAATLILQGVVLQGARYVGLQAVVTLLLAFVVMALVVIVQLRMLARSGNSLEQEISRAALGKLASLRSRIGKHGNDRGNS